MWEALRQHVPIARSPRAAAAGGVAEHPLDGIDDGGVDAPVLDCRPFLQALGEIVRNPGDNLPHNRDASR
jgi:hypothetical protein